MSHDMRQLLAEILQCQPNSITAQSALGVDPRWDSMAQLNIMLALEERYGIEITDETIREYSQFEALERLEKSRTPTKVSG